MNVVNANLKYPKPLTPLNLDLIQYIVIHHAEAFAASPSDIHAWHLENGWNGGGYSEYITKNGTAYIMRGDNVGAHTQGFNSKSYGICCEGNYDMEETMPEVQKAALVERIKFNKARFKNYKLTVPHSQLTDTKCPGRRFPMAEILKRIEVVKLTFNEAIQVLVDNKVITNEAYWRCAADCVVYLKELMINCAKVIEELKK